MRVSFARLSSQRLEGHLLFLLSLEQGDLNGVVTITGTDRMSIESFLGSSDRGSTKNHLLMNEKPAASVHEETAIGVGHVAGAASSHTLDFHFTRGQQVDAGDRLVANGHIAADCADLEALEGRAVLEKGAVGSTHGELHLCELGHDAKETHLLRSERRRALQVCWPHHFYDCYLLINNFIN